MRLLALLLLTFGPPTQHTTQTAAFVEVASTPAGPLAVWLEESGAVRANGHLVGDGAVRIGVATLDDFVLVVWTQADGSVMARRRRADGTEAGVARRIGSNASGPVAVTGAGDRYFIAWAGTLGQIYGAIVTSLGVPIVPAMPITTQSASPTIIELAVAASGDGFAAVWHDFDAREVFAITLTASGTPVSMTPMLVGGGAFPSIASDGSNFFIVWSTDETVFGRTLTAERELGRVRTVTAGIAPRIAWDGFAYALAFARLVFPRPGFAFHQLMTMRTSAYGTYVESVTPTNVLLPRVYDVDARPGRFDFGYVSDGVWTRNAPVGEPRTRFRFVRH